MKICFGIFMNYHEFELYTFSSPLHFRIILELFSDLLLR